MANSRRCSRREVVRFLPFLDLVCATHSPVAGYFRDRHLSRTLSSSMTAAKPHSRFPSQDGGRTRQSTASATARGSAPFAFTRTSCHGTWARSTTGWRAGSAAIRSRLGTFRLPSSGFYALCRPSARSGLSGTFSHARASLPASCTGRAA